MTTKTYVTCPKCNGAKRLAGFSHYAQGVCFECSGNGTVEETGPSGVSGDSAKIAAFAVVSERRAAWVASFDGADPVVVVARFRAIAADKLIEVRNHCAGNDDKGARVAYWAASTVLGMWPTRRAYPMDWIEMAA